MSTDGFPAPEARVRAFIQAQAEEDARTEVPTDEVAWAVPDTGRLTGLSVVDIRDVLAELDSWRTTAESMRERIGAAIDRHPHLVPTTALEGMDR